MNLSSCTLNRYLRLAALLLLLASQGIANAHELVSSHSLEFQHCSICLIGHGVGGAVNLHAGLPDLQMALAPASICSIAEVPIRRSHYYSTRAPPGSLSNAQSPN